jgi:hypothetical protein
MAVDRSKIEKLIDEQIKAVEKDRGDDWEIGDVCVVLEAKLKGKDDTADIRVRFEGGLPKAVVLLRLAEMSLLSSGINAASDS